MLYNGDNPIIQIVSVERIRWDGGTFEVAPRKFSALSLRIGGSTTVYAKGKEYFINTNDILYLPQNMAYKAEYTDTEMIVIHFVTARDDDEIEVYSFHNSEQIYKLFLRMLFQQPVRNT